MSDTFKPPSLDRILFDEKHDSRAELAHRFEAMEAAKGKAEDKAARSEKDANHGKIFLEAGKRPRPGRSNTALDKVLDQVFVGFIEKKKRHPSLNEVVRALDKLATQGDEIHEVIRKVEKGEGTKGEVYWVRRENDERAVATSFKTIDNKLRTIREKYRIIK